jgi:hypothetical protein
MNGEKDRRGFLVTHVVYREQDGTPILKLADIEKAARCMSERRCQTCGLPIEVAEQLGFIGAPGDEYFKEAPIHLRCAAYSFRVCPHLLASERSQQVVICVCRDYEYLPRSAEEIEAGIPARCRPLGTADDSALYPADKGSILMTLTPAELTAYMSTLED